MLQVDLGLLDNDIINVAQIARFDALVAINLPHDSAVSSTNDANLLGVRMEVHWDMRHHLVLRLGFRVQGSGFRVQGSGYRVQGTGYRVQGTGVRVHNLMKFGFSLV